MKDFSKTIILTIGAPGSGKTTWAENYVHDNPNWVNINRDDLRAGMFNRGIGGARPTKNQENIVSMAQMEMARLALANDHITGVIISDTNLNPKTVEKWRVFAEMNKFNLQRKTFHLTYEELRRRNMYRGEKAVPMPVLRNMYQKQYEQAGGFIYTPDISLPEAIIYDLDGTTAIHKGRSPHDLEKLHTDAPNEMVIEHLNAMRQKGYKIITLSGRESGPQDDPNRWRSTTLDWIVDHLGGSDLHLQRASGDKRPDVMVKLELFKQHIAKAYNVRLAVDDRDQVVDMWRRIGLPCWQVNYGEF